MGVCTDAVLSKTMSDQDRLHRLRYHLVRGFVEPNDIVLDLGSGAGYGTYMLSMVAKRVFGIEVEKDEVEAQINNYKKNNIAFLEGNVEKMELPSCDVSCALEVIEHCYKPEKVIKQMKLHTKKYIIISVPVGQELVWSEKDKEFQEKGDKWHKSVFKDADYISSLFVDDDWKCFWRHTEGVNYIGVFYNLKRLCP